MPYFYTVGEMVGESCHPEQLLIIMYQRNLYYSDMNVIQKADLICELELEIW